MPLLPHIWIPFFLLSLTVVLAQGQVQVEWLGPRQGDLPDGDQAHMRLRHYGAGPIDAYVSLLFTGSDHLESSQWRSQVIALPAGQQDLPPGSVHFRQVAGAAEAKQYPPGHYQLCVQVHRQADDQLLAQSCFDYRLEAFEPAEKASAFPQLSFHGSARLQAQYSTLPPTEQLGLAWPGRYLRLEAQPQLELAGVPLRAQVFLTAQPEAVAFDYQMLGLQLDAGALKERLRQSVLQRVAKADYLQSIGQAYDQDLLQHVSGLKEQALAKLQAQYGAKWQALSQVDFQQKLAEIQQIERIEQVMEHPAFRKLAQENRQWEKLLQLPGDFDPRLLKDSVCTALPDRCQAYIAWLSKREEWTQLQAKKASLESLKSQYQQYRTLFQSLQKSQNLSQLLQDPRTLQHIPGISNTMKLLSRLEHLGLGSCFPEFDPMSLSGTRLTGIDLGVNLGSAFLQTTAGSFRQWGLRGLRRDSLRQYLGQSGYLLGLKGGPGQPDGSHLYVSALMARQGQAAQADLWGRFVPLRNVLVGLDARLDLQQKRLQVQLTAHRAFSRVRLIESEQLADWEDLALQGRLSYEAERLGGRFLAHYQAIGPQYVALGAPLLPISRVRYGLEWEQRFWKGQLLASLFFKRDDDPFQPYQLFRQSLASQGLRLRLQAKGLPFAELSYAPYAFRPDQADSLDQAYGFSLLSAQSGYSFRLGQLTASSFVQYTHQRGTAVEAQTRLQSHMLSFTQSLALSIPLSFFATGSYIINQLGTSRQATAYVNLSAQGQHQGWSLAGGWQYATGAQVSGTQRNGAYLDLRIPLLESLQLELRVEHNHYPLSGLLPPDQSEWRLQGGLHIRW